jgi:uncharacterized protein (TIGR02001 family)
MTKLRLAAAAAMLAVTGAAVGGNVSATVGLVSDYDFRGITQTLNDPAFQLGLTYTGDSGVYYGLWGSNVDFQGVLDTYQLSDLDRPSTEIDAFLGFSGEKVVGYDFGVIYYSYPNMGDINTPEVYAGISKGPASFKLWYSWAWGGKGGPREIYAEGNLAIPLTEGFNLLGHIGYTDSNAFLNGHYYDWSAGFGYDVSNFSLTLKYIDGSNLTVPAFAPKNLGRFVFGVSTTLPWAK